MLGTGSPKPTSRLHAAALTALAALTIAGGVAAVTADAHPTTTASLADNTPWTPEPGMITGVQR